MGIQEIADEIARGWHVIQDAPWLFAAALGIVGFGVWRAMIWRYAGTIEALEHRLKLKDDTIVHLEKREKKVSGRRATLMSEPLSSGAVAPALAPVRQPLGGGLKQVEVKERSFTDMTVWSLSKLYHNRTHLQGEKLAAQYIGKWIEIGGIVEIITPLSVGSISVSVSQESPSAGVHTTWMGFNGDRERLEVLHLGDKITAIGEIKSFDQSHLMLVACELLKAG